MPALLLLPSAPQAQYAFSSLLRNSTLHLRTLAAVGALTYPLAYVLSPARTRHPYLIWTGLAAVLGGSIDLLIGQTVFADEHDANGETVERAVRSTQQTEAIKTALGLAAFSMGIIGIWGDGA